MARFVATSPYPTSHDSIGDSTFANNADGGKGYVEGPEDFTDNIIDYMTGAKEASVILHAPRDDDTENLSENSDPDGPTEFTKYLESFIGQSPVPKTQQAAERKNSLQPTVSEEEDEREHELSRFIDRIFIQSEQQNTIPLPVSAEEDGDDMEEPEEEQEEDDTAPLPQHPARTSPKLQMNTTPPKPQSSTQSQSPSPELLKQMEAMQQHISELQRQLANRDTVIDTFRRELSNSQIRSDSLERDVENKEQQTTDLETKLSRRDAEMNKLRQDFSTRGLKIEALERDAQVKDRETSLLQNKIANRDDEIRDLRKELASSAFKIDNLQREIRDSEQRASQLQNKLANHDVEVQGLRQELTTRNFSTETVEERVRIHEKKTIQLQTQLIDRDGEIQDLRKQISARQFQIERLEKQVLTKNKKFAVQSHQLNTAKSTIQAMEAASSDLDIQMAEQIAKREATWKAKMDRLLREREEMSKALMLEWGKQECKGDRDEAGRQAYRYKYVKK